MSVSKKKPKDVGIKHAKEKLSVRFRKGLMGKRSIEREREERSIFTKG